MKKKLLSMLLSIGIISSMTALPVFAAETPTQAEEDVSIETYASEPTPEWAAANGWTYDAVSYTHLTFGYKVGTLGTKLPLSLIW